MRLLAHGCPIVKSLVRYSVRSQSAHIAQFGNNSRVQHPVACEDHAKPTCNEANRRYRSSRHSLVLKLMNRCGILFTEFYDDSIQ
jgi:hypothetical protein